MSDTNEFRERWAEMVVVTESPNGSVFVQNRADQVIEVRIDDGYFNRASLDQLRTQIIAALRLAVADRFRAYRSMLRDVSGLPFGQAERGRRPHADEKRRKSEELHIEGSSADGTVTVSAIGLQHITVSMDGGLWASGDRHTLESNLGAACTSAVQAQFAGMKELTH